MSTKSFIQKVGELAEASPVIRQLLPANADGERAITFNAFAPIAARFPQVNFTFVEEESEDVLPAIRGTLYVDIWVQRKSKEPYKTMAAIDNELKAIFNKRPAVFNNEIDAEKNEGLRVAQSLRQTAEPGYEEDNELYRITTSYKIVVSDNENFQTNYDGVARRGDGKDSWP